MDALEICEFILRFRAYFKNNVAGLHKKVGESYSEQQRYKVSGDTHLLNY